MFGMLKLISTIYFPYHHHMQPISSSQRSTIISLPSEGYSLRQIQSKTGLGKSTIGRIHKEVDLDKEKFYAMFVDLMSAPTQSAAH